MKKIKLLFYLLKVQVKQSKISVVLQLLYGFCLSFQSFPFIIFPSMIINMIMGNQTGMDRIIFAIALFSLVVFVIDFVLSFIVTLQSSYNCKLPHYFNLILAQKALRLDLIDAESKAVVDQYNDSKSMSFDFSGALYDVFLTLISSVIKLAAIAYIVSTLDVFVAFALTAIVLLNYFVNMKSERENQKNETERREVERRKDYAGSLMFDLKAVKDIQAYHAQDFLEEKYIKASKESFHCLKKNTYFNFGMNVLRFVISNMQLMLIYAFVIYKFFTGDILIGSVIMYLSASQEFYSTLTGIFRVFSNLNRLDLYFESYQQFIRIKENIRETSRDCEDVVKWESPQIEFKHVSFRYPNQKEYALKDVNLVIKPSAKISIVGENGAGKSTFVKLLMRLYEAESGEILVNGVDIKKYDYDKYMNLFSPVFQDYSIFSYSIMENICFDKVDENKLVCVLKETELYDRIMRLPNTFNTNLDREFDEAGTELSIGEKQRIAIARAIYKDSPIVILDEPTAALDPVAEYNLYKLIEGFTLDKTAIFISHRLSSSMFCDTILVFDNGYIVESGTHKQLIAEDGIYADLYKRQSVYYQ